MTTPSIEHVGQISIRQSWEYKTVLAKAAGVLSGKMKTANIDEALSEAGSEGWELVSAFQGSNVAANLPGVLLVFKRPTYTGA